MDPAELVKNQHAGSGLYFCGDQIVGKSCRRGIWQFSQLSVPAESVRAEFLLVSGA